MQLSLSARIERFPVAGEFVIARGAKTYVDVVVAEAVGGGITGRGEATPVYYHGETAETVREQLNAFAPIAEQGITRDALLHAMPRGAARNALDAALWDHAAKSCGKPAWQLAGLEAPGPLLTAYTISVGEPEAMTAAARIAAPHYSLLKVKLAGQGDLARVAAVRNGAPNARLIVDANESWTNLDIVAEAAALAALGVELIEQPVAAGQDHLLDGIRSPVPLCADESCQDSSDLARLAGRYAAINIKLDKAGGLTEALMLAAHARAMGLDVMTGCMLSTSLGVAPAFLVGQQSKWVDLDGPLLLAKDREPPIIFNDDRMNLPPALLWG